MSGAPVAAREAPKLNGLVAGAMVGSWLLACELEILERQIKGERQIDAPPVPDPQPPTPEVMAATAVEWNTRAVRAIARIKTLLSVRL